MPNKLDLTGQIFGRLTVIKEANQRKNGKILWLCQCKCGNKILVRGYHLTAFNTRSCGCYNREKAREKRWVHGESGSSRSSLYSVWASMLRRCSDKTHKNYGGRGITVCEAWKEDYLVFRDWALTHGYHEDLEIDRIDNDGNYCPENCRWVTRKENLRNTRQTRWETINGETKSLAEWCESSNLPYSLVHSRLTLGWDLLDALTRPVRKCAMSKLSPNG